MQASRPRGAWCGVSTPGSPLFDASCTRTHELLMTLAPGATSFQPAKDKSGRTVLARVNRPSQAAVDVRMLHSSEAPCRTPCDHDLSCRAYPLHERSPPRDQMAIRKCSSNVAPGEALFDMHRPLSRCGNGNRADSNQCAEYLHHLPTLRRGCPPGGSRLASRMPAKPRLGNRSCLGAAERSSPTISTSSYYDAAHTKIRSIRH